MKKKSWMIIEKICVAGIAVLAIVGLLGISRLHRIQREKETGGSNLQEVQELSEEERLTEPSDFLPGNLSYGKKLPVTVFEAVEGGQVDLLEKYPGETLVLMYWGSWCTYCGEQLQHMEEFETVLQKRKNVRLVLINKTDPEKDESIEKAAAYLKKNGFTQDCVFDVDLKAYQAYGGRRIPTTIVVDPEGYVRAMKAEVLDSAEELENLLEYGSQGGASLLLNFLDKNMRNADGGIYTNYLDSGKEPPSGHDVLSESMGLLMEYAVIAEDRELFDGAYTYVKEYLQKKRLFAWYAEEDGGCAGSNAFLDDIRIAGALMEAHELWGGYEEYRKIAENILIKNSYQGQISSFYDLKQKMAGSEISLCYADFQTLDKLSSAAEGFSDRKEKLLAVVQEGYIGDDFPLYYSFWSYKTKKYAKDSLNTAEALLTLYHLAEVGLLKSQSLEWLRERLLQNDLAARYETDGSVVQGYDYDSTAVYAIAALIGRESGDAQIYMLALQKMEQTRVTDADSPFYGGFTNKSNGDDLTAFDQLMPLQVYADFGRVNFE